MGASVPGALAGQSLVARVVGDEHAAVIIGAGVVHGSSFALKARRAVAETRFVERVANVAKGAAFLVLFLARALVGLFTASFALFGFLATLSAPFSEYWLYTPLLLIGTVLMGLATAWLWGGMEEWLDRVR